MSDSELNKSEDASAYKLEQARKKGVVARSPELGFVVSLLCFAAYLWARGDELGVQLTRLMARAFGEAASLTGGGGAVIAWSSELFSAGFGIALPVIAAVVLGTLAASLAQVGMLFAPSALKADLNRLNPVAGMKRLFSIQVLIEAGKTLLKIVIYGWLTIDVVRGQIATVMRSDTPAQQLPDLLMHGALRLLLFLSGAAFLFAAIDQIIVRRMFARKMRMSKHEVTQEHRQREGDPRIKRRRKQLQRELLKRSRSMRGVRHADVVVANPTHIVVALRYEPGKMRAPTVVAKGAGEFALRLRKLAFIYGVPVVESKPLARELFRTTDLDTEVPAAMYRAAAAIYLHLRRSGRQAA